MELLGSRQSYAMEIVTKPLVMASEISGLQPLHGFIKQENKVVPAHFLFAGKRRGQPEFIERKMPEISAQAVTANAGSSHRATQDSSSGPGHAPTFRCAR